MHCKSCKNKLADIDIYCHACGKPTEEYKKQFNVSDVLKSANVQSFSETHKNIAYNVIVAIAIIAVMFLFFFDIINFSKWKDYLILNIIMIPLSSLMILPLANVLDNIRKLQFKYYPKLLMFTFFMATYFFILKLICQGDPILNIVRFVMVLWGVAIAFPVPFMIFFRDESVITLIKKGYIAGKYLRWHQFYLALNLGLRLLGSAILLFIPFSHTIANASKVMLTWYLRQDKFKLYDKSKDY